MLIIILQIGTRLFCSSSLGLVTLISMGEIQDGCTVIKVYCNLGNHNIPMHSVNTTQHTHTHTGMFMVQTEDFSLFSHCLDIVYFSDVPIGFVHKIYRGLSPVWLFPGSLLLKSSVINSRHTKRGYVDVIILNSFNSKCFIFTAFQRMGWPWCSGNLLGEAGSRTPHLRIHCHPRGGMRCMSRVCNPHTYRNQKYKRTWKYEWIILRVFIKHPTAQATIYRTDKKYEYSTLLNSITTVKCISFCLSVHRQAGEQKLLLHPARRCCSKFVLLLFMLNNYDFCSIE